MGQEDSLAAIPKRGDMASFRGCLFCHTTTQGRGEEAANPDRQSAQFFHLIYNGTFLVPS